MEEIKDFVFEDVIFQLKTYHGITINDAVIDVISKIIDEEYDNFITSTDNWEPDPYISCVIEKTTKSI